MNLLPVKKKRVYHTIVEQIKSAIEKEEIVHGEKLPSERSLANEFSVSRTSVKEAFSVLESAGVVEIKHGSGVYLRKDTKSGLISKMNTIIRGVTVDIVELMELRLAIERDAAYYAAIRGLEKDVQAIYDALCDLENAVLKGDVAAKEDLTFHMAIAKAAGNSVFEKVMYMLSDQVLEGLKESRSNTLKQPYNSKAIVEEHRNIYAAIKKGDAQMAQECMTIHLQNVKERYL
ncbi:FadR/GntR family transcriptional regulator [Virgibacillus siamensis]|uniref:FadR/GntR family transcriptional regulator n=1 Tax=Virgibacillus siamensis TaxID=480071 RepID=UPI00098542A3|nr:FadR/GntR family transcriptional regulator [Virgibacillus siamensis]